MSQGEGEGKEKYPCPRGLFVCKIYPYTRWTGALIGAVGCKLIDACQSRVGFFSAVRRAEETCDLDRK